MAAKETDEVMVTPGHLIPTQEFDRVKSAVCLLRPSSNNSGESWKASGFYVQIKLKRKKDLINVYCIMTNYHVFQMMEDSRSNMVAVFKYEGAGENPCEYPLVPFTLLASCKDLDYVLIRVDENKIKSFGVEPIVADTRYAPRVDDTVYVIQHPGGRIKHFSTERIKNIVPPFIEYYADTLSGSSGSPVFIVIGAVYVLVGLHSKGVSLPPFSWNKGVLLSEILNHLTTGKYTKPPSVFSHGVPFQMESGVQPAMQVQGKKDPSLQVTARDNLNIALDITKEWRNLGLALGVSESRLDIIDADNPKAYDKAYTMLTAWIQTKVSQANFGALATGFAHPAVARNDLISKHC